MRRSSLWGRCVESRIQALSCRPRNCVTTTASIRSAPEEQSRGQWNAPRKACCRMQQHLVYVLVTRKRYSRLFMRLLTVQVLARYLPKGPAKRQLMLAEKQNI